MGRFGAAPPLGGEGSRRSRRGDHRLQLPHPAGAREAVAGHRGRLHGGAEGRARHPAVTLALGELIAEQTDIPPGVVNVLIAADVPVGEALTTSPDVDAVSFTGSTPTGRRIMAAAARP